MPDARPPFRGARQSHQVHDRSTQPGPPRRARARWLLIGVAAAFGAALATSSSEGTYAAFSDLVVVADNHVGAGVWPEDDLGAGDLDTTVLDTAALDAVAGLGTHAPVGDGPGADGLLGDSAPPTPEECVATGPVTEHDVQHAEPGAQEPGNPDAACGAGDTGPSGGDPGIDPGAGATEATPPHEVDE